MRWHNAVKVLPPPGQIVLVKEPDEPYDYQVCQLAVLDHDDPYAFIFLPWSDNGSCVEIKEGTLWAKITLPEEGGEKT
jgi:hypothetical protein